MQFLQLKKTMTLSSIWRERIASCQWISRNLQKAQCEIACNQIIPRKTLQILKRDVRTIGRRLRLDRIWGKTLPRETNYLFWWGWVFNPTGDATVSCMVNVGKNWRCPFPDEMWSKLIERYQSLEYKMMGSQMSSIYNNNTSRNV